MVTASLPFAILILSSYHGVSERIVSELQSFCFAIHVYRNRNEDGRALQKKPFSVVQFLACIYVRNVVDPPLTKCMDKALSVSKDYFYNSKINILP